MKHPKCVRKKNRGSFRKGPDPRRHRFTTSDCRIGYWVVMLGLTERTRDPAVREWVRLKVKIHFSRKEKENGQVESKAAGDAARQRNGSSRSRAGIAASGNGTAEGERSAA